MSTAASPRRSKLPSRHVAVPLARPVVALAAFFSFVVNWNNFFLPFVMLPNSGQYPIQVGLENLLSSTPSFNPAPAPALTSPARNWPWRC